MPYIKPSGEKMHNLHIRIPYAVWRKFRTLYPDKGDVQQHGLMAIKRYIGWPIMEHDVDEVVDDVPAPD